MFPQKIRVVSKKELEINWSDNTETTISLMDLRKLCPCAVCESERENQSSKFIPLFSGNQINVMQVKQVGTYAISIVWKDGHSTGIYEYSYLRNISRNKGTGK